jgi:hypothetical protein
MVFYRVGGKIMGWSDYPKIRISLAEGSRCKGRKKGKVEKGEIAVSFLSIFLFLPLSLLAQRLNAFS